MGERVLNHEKLLVYQHALQFIEFVDKILSRERDKINAHFQLDKASTSIPLNIAEGSGKYTPKDKNRFYDIARGSASESSSCLDVLFIRKKINNEEKEEGKGLLIDIVSMLVGLIKSNSNRVYEESENYKSDKI